MDNVFLIIYRKFQNLAGQALTENVFYIIKNVS